MMAQEATTKIFKSDLAMAKRLWPGQISRIQIKCLRTLCSDYNFSVETGDLLLLEGRWYVTHAGLLHIAQRRRCHGIKTFLQKDVSDPIANRWVFKATVYKTLSSRGFVGFGDADPSNVSPLVRGSELRIAETRSVNRALRKAYGIGVCSVEELGYHSSPPQPPTWKRGVATASNGDGSGTGQPRLRDRLCLLIRQRQLDPALVKRYAADFCGTQEIREASRELVQSFITHLTEWAVRDHSGLLCKLNSFAPSQEVSS